MTNYYAYRNWVIRLEAPLFGNNKVCAFDLNTGAHHYFIADKGDTHSFICQYIDLNYSSTTDYSVGLPGLMLLSGRDKMMATEIFNRFA